MNPALLNSQRSGKGEGELPSYPKLWRRVFSSIFLLFQLKELLCQDFPVLQQVCQVSSSFLCADKNLDFICKPALEK